jgi:hypothetical protein
LVLEEVRPSTVQRIVEQGPGLDADEDEEEQRSRGHGMGQHLGNWALEQRIEHLLASNPWQRLPREADRSAHREERGGNEGEQQVLRHVIDEAEVVEGVDGREIRHCHRGETGVEGQDPISIMARSTEPCPVQPEAVQQAGDADHPYPISSKGPVPKRFRGASQLHPTQHERSMPSAGWTRLCISRPKHTDSWTNPGREPESGCSRNSSAQVQEAFSGSNADPPRLKERTLHNPVTVQIDLGRPASQFSPATQRSRRA